MNPIRHDLSPAQKTARRHLWLAAGGMLALLCVVYAACGYWPFGPNSMMTGDLNGQYIPFYAHFYTALRSGTGSLVYSDSIGLGGGAFALLAYYFASPFAWLYLLVAPEHYGALCGVVYGLKITLAAVAFLHYLHRHTGHTCPLWVPLSWCYGWMGYSVAYAQNVLWLDAVILLPLVAAGLDRLLRRQGCVGCILALAAAIFTNFYMGYMLCLFAVLYTAAGLAAGAGAPGGVRAVGGAFLRLAGTGLCAAALAGVILVPAVVDILGVKNSTLALDAGTEFSLPALVQKFFTGNFVWADVQTGLPPVYCGMLGLGGAVLYAASRRPRREKAAAAGLVAVLVLSLWIAPLNLVWHGLAAPNWFPYRQSFLLVFVLLTLAALGLESARSRKGWLAAAVAAAALCGLVLFCRAETYGRRRWLLAAAALAAALGLAWLWARLAGRRRQLCALALAVLAGGELALNSVWALRQFEVYPAADYAAYVQEGRQTAAAIAAQDEGVWRTEKRFYRTLNDPLLLGYRGFTHFSSVQEGTATDLLVALGYSNFGSCYGYLAGSTAAADSLLGVRYYMTRTADEAAAAPSHFTPIETDAPWQVYENENALPPALWTAAEASDLAADTAQDTFAVQEALYTALLGRPAGLFTAVEAPASGAEFTLTAPADGILYAVFTGSDTDVTLTVDGRDKGKIFTSECGSGNAIDLGRVRAGQTVTVTLDGTAETAVFAVMDEAALADACAALTEAAPAVTEWKEGDITLTTDQSVDGLVVLTVPFSENWRVTIDGAPAAASEAAGALLAVAVPAGNHTITLRYTQPGAAAGAALTLAGAVDLVAAVWAGRRRKKHA